MRRPAEDGRPCGLLRLVSYTPKHLAEEILTSRSALEGESKQMTELFAREVMPRFRD